MSQEVSMLDFNRETNLDNLLHAADLIATAARTAPKGKGKDLLVTAVVTGEEKDRLCRKMREIALRDEVPFFERDAGGVERVAVLLLLGTRKEPLGLPKCGYCGYDGCGAMLAAKGTCVFNTGDLGIAVGSAASRAADLRIDNRILYSAGKAAVELGLLGDDVPIVYAIPLSVSGKNPFFDRG